MRVIHQWPCRANANVVPQLQSVRGRQALTMATNESMTGTSTNTPTTVARAAPEFRPNSEIATATANSKKLDVPIRQAGRARNVVGELKPPGAPPAAEEDAIRLQDQWHCDQRDDTGLPNNRSCLKAEQ